MLLKCFLIFGLFMMVSCLMEGCEECPDEASALSKAFHGCKAQLIQIWRRGPKSDGRRKRSANYIKEMINKILSEHVDELKPTVEGVCKAKMESDVCCKNATDTFEVDNIKWLQETLMCKFGGSCYDIYITNDTRYAEPCKKMDKDLL